MTNIRDENLIRRAEKAIPIAEPHVATSLRRNIKALRKTPGNRDVRFKLKSWLCALRAWLEPSKD